MGMAYFEHFCSCCSEVRCKQFLDEICVTYCTNKPEWDMSFLLYITWEVVSVSKGIYTVNQLISGFPRADVAVLELVDPMPLWETVVHGLRLDSKGTLLHCAVELSSHVAWQAYTGWTSCSLWYVGIQNILYPVTIVSRFSNSPWRWNHEVRDSWNSSYWSEEEHLKVGIFRVTVGGFGFRAANTVVRATSESGSSVGRSSIG